MKLPDGAGLAILTGLVAVAGALILFVWLAGEVLEGDMSRFDDAVRTAVNRNASPAVTYLMRSVTMLGSTPFLIALGISVFIAFFRTGRRRGTVLFIITIVGAMMLNLAMKTGFRRARPLPFFGIEPLDTYSFPSGHALTSFCLYIALAALITACTTSRVLRIVTWTLAVLLVVIIGLSRVYLGMHYPSDVLAGYTAGMVWVTVVATVDRLLRMKERPE